MLINIIKAFVMATGNAPKLKPYRVKRRLPTRLNHLSRIMEVKIMASATKKEAR